MIGTFRHDGIRFVYEVVGDGRPILTLHGLGGDRAQALGLIPEGPWQRIAIDMRAHGDTEPVGRADAFGFGTFADDVTAFLDELGLSTVAACGVSLGAGVALRFALDHPERVEALGLVRPAWIHIAPAPSQAVWPEIVRLLRTEGREQGQRTFRASPAHEEVGRISQYAADSLCTQFDDPRAVERVSRLEGLPRSTPYRDPGDLSRILVPTLVIGTDRDPQHPLDFAITWARGIPGAALLEVTSKAIDPEAHNEEVRQAIGRFLDEVLR